MSPGSRILDRGRGRGGPRPRSRVADRESRGGCAIESLKSRIENLKAELDLGALLRAQLDRVDPETGRKYAELLIESWVSSAIAGNFRAVQEILDRTEAARDQAPAPASFDEAAALRVLEEGS